MSSPGLAAISTQTQFRENLAEVPKPNEEPGDILAAVQAVAQSQGCRYFVITTHPDGQGNLSDIIAASNLPSSLVETLDHSGWLSASIPYRKIRRSHVPVIWRTDLAKIHSADSDNIAPIRMVKNQIMSDHQVLHGIACPIHSPSGQCTIALFTGRSQEFQLQEIDQLHLAMLKIYQHAHNTYRANCMDAGNLTHRECDCLYWTAAGKTSNEIGTILSISQHTVNHYLTGAIQKLNAINRTQAVVKALHFSLIEYPPTGNPGRIWN